MNVRSLSIRLKFLHVVEDLEELLKVNNPVRVSFEIINVSSI